MSRLILVTLALSLIGCRLEMEAEVYSSDIRKAASDPSAALAVPMKLSIPIPSAEECDQYKGEVTKIATKRLINFHARSCRTVEFESYLEATADVPLVHLNYEDFKATSNVTIPVDSVLTFVSVKAPDPERSSLGLFVDPAGFAEIQAEIKEQYLQSLSLEDGRATIVLTNDEPEKQRYRVASVFHDGEPVPLLKEFELERRKKTTILVSELWMAQLARGAVIWPTSVLDAP